MKKTDILKKILPGLLPLFVFIIADEIWGTNIGLIVAVAFGVLQMIYVFIKEKRIDKFTFLDIGLIVILGLVSIILENDIFFKLKPALIGVILCTILGISGFSRFNIIATMSGRYMKGFSFNEIQLIQIIRSIRILFYIFSLHTLLVFYSAFYMSKEAWVFISGGLFYIIFGVYFIYELIYKKIKNLKYKDEEWLPIVDENGNVKGKAPRSLCHKNKKLLHPVIHLHVINSKNQIFLQKRPMFKKVQPGKWDTAVGGHISIDETLEEALKRETLEEIGISNFEAKFLTKYKWESEIENELVFMFITKKEKIENFNLNEIDDGKFWSINQIEINLGKEIFTPNFEYEFDILLKRNILNIKLSAI